MGAPIGNKNAAGKRGGRKKRAIPRAKSTPFSRMMGNYIKVSLFPWQVKKSGGKKRLKGSGPGGRTGPLKRGKR